MADKEKFSLNNIMKSLGVDSDTLSKIIGSEESRKALIDIEPRIPEPSSLLIQRDYTLEHAQEAEEQRKQDAKNQISEIQRLVNVTEDQRIVIEKLIEVTEQQGNSSGKFSRWSLGFSIFAVLLAGTAVFFSALDFKGDLEWQTKQITVLNEIRDFINPVPED